MLIDTADLDQLLLKAMKQGQKDSGSRHDSRRSRGGLRFRGPVFNNPLVLWRTNVGTLAKSWRTLCAAGSTS
jgi:hypothetical protein